MALYTCIECKKINLSSIRPPTTSKSGRSLVCPDCASNDEVQEGHLEELRLQAMEPTPLNGLGEE